jgi:hypothetical protein
LPPLRRLIVLIAALGLLVPAVAQAGSRADMYRDCQDGRIDGKYTQKQFSDALANVPTDVDEYTDCRDVIRRAQLAAAGGGGSKSGSGGTGGGATGGGGTGGSGTTAPATRADPLAAASPKERAAVERTRAAESAPVEVAGRLIAPAPLGYGAHGSVSDIPTPLLVVLILLAASALAGGGIWLRSRVVARRTA